MDAIQLALLKHSKRIIQHTQYSISKKETQTEASNPLLRSDFETLINTHSSLENLNYQYELGHNQFKFLCKHNLLFFLTVTRQFHIVERLYKSPSFFEESRQLIALINREEKKASHLVKKFRSVANYRNSFFNEKQRVAQTNDMINILIPQHHRQCH